MLVVALLAAPSVARADDGLGTDDATLAAVPLCPFANPALGCALPVDPCWAIFLNCANMGAGCTCR